MKSLHSVLSWLATLLVPVALIFLPIRLLLTPVFPEVEYRMPGFPPDEYGFTQADRIHNSKIAIQYLVNAAGPSFLGDLDFPDGSPLYNEREVSHMRDVKGVVRPFLWTGTGACLLLLGLGLWAWRGRWADVYRRGLRRGGWLILALAAGIGIYAAIDFWGFFSLFHALFFKGDTWLFLFTDTLIRLFPLRFWQDAVIFIGLVTLGGGLGLALGLREGKKTLE
jgi:integral membrane protein (TIGR01906 family)